MLHRLQTLRLLYPLWAALAMYSMLYVPAALHMNLSPQQVANNIAAESSLFRSGIICSLITQILSVVIAYLLYQIFYPTHRPAALLLLLLAIAAVPIAMLNDLNHLAILHSLHDVKSTAFYIELHRDGIAIASLFWGLWLLPLAYLLYKKKETLKWLSLSLVLAAIGYMAGSFHHLLAWDWATGKIIFELLTFGEIVWLLWLLIKGKQLMPSL